MAPTEPTTMEFQAFWGQHGDEAQHDSHDELLEFWQGHGWLEHEVFHGTYQDFHATLQPRVGEPVPVPSPATQGDSSVFTSHFSEVSLRRGEGWRGPLPAWSPGETTSSRQGRTKQVEHEHNRSRVVKRAYKRACQRAVHAPSGCTWYCGQWLSGAMLRAQDISQQPEIPAQVRPISHRRSQVRPHYSLLTWNVGGLAANNWDALQYWLHLHNIHICCIQETRWNLVSEWCNGQFYVFHSGSGRSGGLMTLVSTRLAPRGSIRTCTLANGRIQHTRVFRPNGSIDIINIYQKVWSHDSVENIVAQRKVVWNALRELLDSLPARNQVMICGDMNTQLPFTKGVTGTAVGEQAYRDTRDEHELQSILRLHGLQAVNTFHDTSRHTFVGPGARTLLDYVFMRARQAGGLAKQAKGLHDFPLLAARGDCYHVPVLVQFPKHWQAWTRREAQQPGPNRREVAKYIATHPQVAQQCIQSRLQGWNGDFGELDGALVQAQADIASQISRGTSTLLKPWQDESFRGTLGQAWEHLHQSRQQNRHSVQGLFQAWVHMHKFQKLIKSTRTQCRRMRRHRLLAVLEEAQQGEAKRDIGHVYRMIDRIAPKRSQAKPQLRNTQGHLLDAQQETVAIVEHLRQVYQGEAASGPSTVYTPDLVFVSAAEIHRALTTTPANKAGPKHLAINAVYKCGAPILSPILHNFLSDWWGGRTPFVPQAFRDAWLIMLAKPGKPCRSPGDMRPIGLSHPLGKALLRTLRARIMPYAQTFLDFIPQWGFLPGREAADALSKAFGHCASVRTLLKQQSLNINHRKAGAQRLQVAGGVAVALDISKAFDTIPHREIMLALQAAAIPEDIQYVVWQWITGARYHVKGDIEDASVAVGRGVRQGCVLSPLLYVLVAANVHARLREKLGSQADDSLDYYADDTLFHEEFRSTSELRSAVRHIELLWDVLLQAGLVINDAKTQVLLKIAGSHAKQALRDFTEVRRGNRFLRLKALGQQRLLPVVTQARCLGAQISYENFEDATVHHRITAARATFGRLRKVLTSRSSLSCQARVKLWRACVGATLFYSLASVGVTLSGLQKVRVLVQQQLRAISRMPAHLTKVSNQELLSKLGIAEPGAHILDGMQRLLQSWRNNYNNPECIQVKTSQIIFQWRQQLVSDLSSVLQGESQGGRTFLTCIHCGLECANKSTLGSHIAKVHAAATKPVFDRLKHSVGGMPRCSGCKQLLSSWSRLQKHIEKGACPCPIETQLTVLEQPQQASQVSAEPQQQTAAGSPDQKQTEGPLLQDSQVQQIVKQHGWRALAEDKAFRPKLAQWCSLCGTWCASNRAVKMHLARSHGDTWKPHSDRIEKLCKTQTASVTSPCSLCGSVSKTPKAHVSTCPVLFQSILLELLINGGIGQTSGTGPVQTLITSGSGTGKPANGGLAGQQSGKTEQKAKAVDEPGQAREERPKAPVRKSDEGPRPAQRVGRDATATGSHSQAFFACCGGAAADSSGLRVHLVRGHGAGQYPAGDVHHQQGVAEASKHCPRSDHQAAVHHDDGVHPHGVQGKGDEDDAGPGHEGNGHFGRSLQRSGPVGVQKLEPGSEDLGADQPAASGYSETDRDAGHDAARHSGIRSAAQVPCIKAAAGRHDSRQGGGVLHNTSGASGSGCGALVCQSGTTLRLHGTSSIKEQTQTGKKTGIGDRKSSGGSSAQAVTRMQLRNSGNVCYINTTVHMIAWMLEQSGAQVTCLGAGANAFKSVLMAGKMCSVLQLFTWRPIFQQWQHGGRQHDVAEFIAHVIHCCQAIVFRGDWEARVMLGDRLQVDDRGSCTQLISLDVPENGPWTLQELIDNWGAQARVHALVSAPQWLVLRLSRFRQTSDGLGKVRSAMSWGAEVRMPCFGDGIQTACITYAVKSCAVHLGSRVDEGHYRALLCSGVGELRYCDDNRCAELLTDFESVARDVYVVMLSRTDFELPSF